MSQKYQNLYDKLISHYQTNEYVGYTENHHIIPKCLGGSNKKENLVRIPARVHFLLHWMLCRIHPSNTQLAFAWNSMCMKSWSSGGRYTSHNFKYARVNYAKSLSVVMIGNKCRLGIPHTEEMKEYFKTINAGENNGMYGKNHTDYSKKLMSDSKMGKVSTFKGKTHTEDTKKLMSEQAKLRTGDKNPFYGKKHSDETKRKISETRRVNREKNKNTK